MDIFGVGPLELFFILLIALIVLGPNDMVKAGKTLGRFLRNLVTSPTWRAVQQTSRELRYLPNRLMREAGMDELQKDLQKELPNQNQLRKEMGLDGLKSDLNADLRQWNHSLSDWTTTPDPAQTIAPPSSTPVGAPPVTPDLPPAGPEPEDTTPPEKS